MTIVQNNEPACASCDEHAQRWRTPICLGGRRLTTRFFLAPLAGYTHLAFRVALRRLQGLGLATTDLVQATMLWSERPKSLELVATTPEDRPLTVQLFSGSSNDIVRAAKWLEDRGYEAIDLNMGCPMAKVNGAGGGARLMCDTDGAVQMAEHVVKSVRLPVSVKMRLGWDSSRLTAPAIAAAMEEVGVVAVTIHGRTRAQGFHGNVNREGIRAVVDAVRQIPIIANGDVRTVDDAISMFHETECSAVAIGRGAMLDPWIFRRLQYFAANHQAMPEPSPDEQIDFLSQHFYLMTEQHEDHACLQFRKFAAWYGARLGIPEDLEDRLRRFQNYQEFDQIVTEIRQRHGERKCTIPTALIKVPNGPVEHW